MNRKELVQQIKNKSSFLCIGLDTDLSKIPQHILESDDPVFYFNKAIIDSTHDLCVAYKPNLAFYESLGLSGWQSLEKTVNYCKEMYPELFLIADAKRGDIGNTSKMYAKAFFENMNFDAVTVAPYMGADSVLPFLGFEGKWVILLALTSNKGAADFQFFGHQDTKLYQEVIKTSSSWADKNSLMFVVGATKAESLKEIRKIAPDHFLLIPGVGAQGGSLNEVAKNGLITDCGVLVNASRSIIYAGNDINFADLARAEAQKLKDEMEANLKVYCSL